MPRAVIGPINANSGAEYRLLMETTKPIRIRGIGAFVNTLIVDGGGAIGVTMQAGIATPGDLGTEQEVFASIAMTALAVGAQQAFTVANQVQPAGKSIVFKVTATTRNAGTYSIYFDWDDDY